jgi:hypothetical protein
VRDNPSVFGNGGGHLKAAAAGSLAGLVARVPMWLLTAGVAIAAVRGEIGRYLSVLLVLAVFTDFNAVIFVEYLAWAVPFLVLAACEPNRKPERPESGARSYVIVADVRESSRA